MNNEQTARERNQLQSPIKMEQSSTNNEQSVINNEQSANDNEQSSSMTATTHPIIHTTLSLSPQNYTQGDEPPTLTISLTLSAPAPITIFTHHGIFNTDLALGRRNFTVHDIPTDPPTPINIECTKGGRRPGFQRRKGHRDEQYYVTLSPEVECKIQCPFRVVDTKLPVTSLPNLQTGRKYRLGVSKDEKIGAWWWGTRDDVLLDDEETYEEAEPPRGDAPINICADPIDFEVKEA